MRIKIAGRAVKRRDWLLLFRIKQEVSGLRFNELLERVYTEHPEFAVNSIFRRSA